MFKDKLLIIEDPYNKVWFVNLLGTLIRTADGLYTRALLDDILSGYDNRIIPRVDDNTPLRVKVGITLRQIIELVSLHQNKLIQLFYKKYF